jgi:hypothetical protein
MIHYDEGGYPHLQDTFSQLCYFTASTYALGVCIVIWISIDSINNGLTYLLHLHFMQDIKPLSY